MTVQYGGKTKEAKLKDLYDDIATNEKEWMMFLYHPYNIEFVFECVAVCHEYATILYDTHKDRDTCLEVLDIEKKLLDILQKLSAHFDEHQNGAFGNLEYEYDNFIFKKGLVVLISGKGNAKAKLFKKLVRFEKKNNPPDDYLGYIWLWGQYRKELKERGMDMREVPHNVEEVDDKVLTEHMRFRGMEAQKGKKRNDMKLNKDLIDFFEMDGTVVSHQKKKRIKDFVEGLNDKQAIEMGAIFGGGMGGLSIKQKKGIRKVVNDVDDLKYALDKMH